ncbi:WYL domain-containing protein [Psychromonas antarctica]|uniref:WYL domain-containing protein n=1 Tax=Psychromonas antarctica TaxID=67573 RepID=UPI001EE9309E|nr:WYL domain-containing protein [Psychromonas antarctica]MCG6201150.1 WYL domain-containing protein [Psychromonas antarctica]
MLDKIDQRFVFIENIAWWEGQINTRHLREKYSISQATAQKTLKQYQQKFPNNLTYSQSEKTFIVNDEFTYLTDLNNFSRYLSNVSLDEKTPISDHIFEVEAPLRNINPQQVRPILRAIREKLAIDIGYLSLANPDYLDRIIQPHSLIFDGLRWHVRAYCNKNQSFRDFSLSRFNGEAIVEGKATHFAEQDERWNTWIDIVIEPDPRLSGLQKQIIAKDYQMESGRKVIPVRAALVNYLLKRLNIDHYQNTPEAQQIVLSTECRKAVTPYLPQPT